MDVDAPNLLKRCSSAPLINEAVSTVVTSPTTSSAPRNSLFFNMFTNNNLRTRRSSASSSLNSCLPRVNQLRAEECADVSNTREVAHERETHSAMQMGQSCEDLTLLPSPGLAHSPTRLPRFSPVVSPSPTRKNSFITSRRSQSPIALRESRFSPVSRPTVLSGKRRGDEADSPLSKRMCMSDRMTPTTPGTPDSDSLECTFRPVSPRAQSMIEALDSHRPSSPG